MPVKLAQMVCALLYGVARSRLLAGRLATDGIPSYAYAVLSPVYRS